jgi:hypothetical protein
MIAYLDIADAGTRRFSFLRPAAKDMEQSFSCREWHTAPMPAAEAANSTNALSSKQID